MTKDELYLRLIECAKGVLDENAEHPGAFVAGWVQTDRQNNGIVLSGDGGDIVILLAQTVDKIAIKSGQSYKRVLRDMRDILRFLSVTAATQSPARYFSASTALNFSTIRTTQTNKHGATGH